ncbi:MAG: hypothetical protein ACRDZS_03075, partial [Acidimicrobiales bacterium]
MLVVGIELVVDDGVVVVGGVVVGGVVVGGVVVGGGVSQPDTQNTLCFTSAPWDPSELMVSLMCQPCWGCGSKPVSKAERSYVSEASSLAS